MGRFQFFEKNNGAPHIVSDQTCDAEALDFMTFGFLVSFGMIKCRARLGIIKPKSDPIMFFVGPGFSKLGYDIFGPCRKPDFYIIHFLKKNSLCFTNL